VLKIAFKLLIKNKAKYIVIILGLSFSCFIITQQAGIFIGLMARTYYLVTDTPQPDIWITNPLLEYFDDRLAIKEEDIYKIRSLEGVQWALPLAKGFAKIIYKDTKNIYQTCYFFGIDDASLIGAPPKMIEGNIEHLRFPDAIIISQKGSPKRFKINDVIEVNSCRSKIVGICKSTHHLHKRPIIYTTYSKFKSCCFKKGQIQPLNFIIVKAKKNTDLKKLCNQIKKQYNLNAYTTKQFKYFILRYYLTRTGLPLNFGISVLLGFVIGIALAGKAFYDFILSNKPYLALFKSMGAQNKIILKMTFVQFAWAGFISWAFGTGFASLVGLAFSKTDVSFKCPWELYCFTMFTIFLICALSIIFSLKNVMKIEPATLFQY